VDEAFEISGGYGIFQVFSSFFLIIAMGSVAFFLYAFSFLEHRPKYQCLYDGSSQWEACPTSAFCAEGEPIKGASMYKSGVQWRVNYEDRDSIHNLIEQLDFHCQPDYKIGLMGSSFLFGMVIGCLTLARMGDLYGRKRIFLLGMSCQLLATVGLLVSHSDLVVYLLLLTLGWAVTGKQFVGYSYLLEL
jgi:MFS family permease